jgi:hypothetical protein
MIEYQLAHMTNYRHSYGFTVNITILRDLPPVPCRLYEFEPATEEIRYKLNYVPDAETGEFKISKTTVPTFALDENEWKSDDISKWDDFMADYVNNYLEIFAKGCYDFQGLDDFLGSILRYLTEYKPDNLADVSV